MDRRPTDPVRARLVAEFVDVLCGRDLGGGQSEVDAPDWHGDRLFGGVLVGQATYAVSRTIAAPMRVHSLHGYFLRPAAAKIPMTISVEAVRDGRSFATRRLVTEQDGRAVFTAMASCTTDEEGDPRDDYEPAMPSVAAPRVLPPGEWDDGPLVVDELGPSEPGPDGFHASSRRMWIGLPEPIPADPAVHLAMLAYLSDMTGSSFRPRTMGTWGTHTDASLDHAVWFHRPGPADEWLLYDTFAPLNAGARANVRGTMWSHDGRILMTMGQELLIRRLPPP